MTGDLDEANVQTLLDLAETDVVDGRLPACQLAVARGGQVVVSRTFGSDEGARFTVFSVTKALTASALWLFLADALTPETPIADLIPELRQLPGVTVEHLLTHTAGFPRAPMLAEEGADPERRRARFRTWQPDWEPGSQTEYHPSSAHWVVADLLERVSGQDFRAVVRTRVIDPLGLATLRLGLGADEDAVEEVVLIGQPADRDDLPTVATDAQLLRFNEPAVRAAGVPGAGAVSTAADIAVLYQALLHNPERLWDPRVLSDATGRVRNSMTDPWTGVPALRTLGLSIAGDDGNGALRQFGKAAGPRSFGASGVGGQMAWADPESGLSFCFLTSGIDCDPVASWVRSTRLSTAAARCARVTA